MLKWFINYEGSRATAPESPSVLALQPLAQELDLLPFCVLTTSSGCRLLCG